MDETNNQPHERERSARSLLARALRRARGSLFWERLWPALAALATVLGLFLAFSWAGLWLVLPPLARAIGLFIFAVAIAVSALPLLIVRLPSVHDGLRRLDRSTGETHRPATTVADRIAANSQDPVAQALWQAHVERALRLGAQIQGRMASRRDCRCAIRWRFALSCSFLWWRVSLPPAESAQNALPRLSTGMALSRRRIFASMPGSRRRSIRGGLR